jgi:hypothetical protein
MSWAAKIIPVIWEYTTSLWEHRNGILHGQTLAETEQRELEALQQQITTAYKEYNNDHFIIPRQLSSLFTSCSLQKRLKMDMDSMKCWLHSVSKAKEAQSESNIRHAEAINNFFFPRHIILQDELMPPSETATTKLSPGSSLIQHLSNNTRNPESATTLNSSGTQQFDKGYTISMFPSNYECSTES